MIENRSAGKDLCAAVDASPQTPPRPTRVLVADDETLFAEALALMLARDERIEVVGSARDGQEAIALADKLRPDLVLMDIAMPVIDGIEATRRIRAENPDVQILILTGVIEDKEKMTKAREAGASAFITKNQTAAELTDAIGEISALVRAFAVGDGAGVSGPEPR
jgi:DNA-binding NarL/FixJ family response regulator